MILPNSQFNISASQLSGVWWLVLVFGAIATLFGLYCVFNPIGVGTSMMWVVGLFAIAEGVVGLIGVVRGDTDERLWVSIYALLSLAFGFFALFKPEFVATILMTVVAVWFIASGVLRVLFALRVRNQVHNEWMLIGSGLLAVVIGLLTLVAPLVGLAVAIIWIGIAVAFYGVLQVFTAFKMRKVEQGALQ